MGAAMAHAYKPPLQAALVVAFIELKTRMEDLLRFARSPRTSVFNSSFALFMEGG